jgi:hypothetical protein
MAMRPATLRLPSVFMGTVLLGAVFALPASASADEAEQPTTAVLQPATSHSDDARLAGAVERVLRAHMDDLDVVTVAGTPALGLSDLQLAVGCVGETDSCLQAVAEQIEVEALLLSSIDRADDALVLTVTFFDARDGGRQSAMRREEGRGAANRLLEGIDPLLRELFGLPAPVGPARAASDIEDEPARSGRPALPWVVAGVGLAGLITGGALGFVARGTENDYAAVTVDTAADAERAGNLFDKSRRQARAAHAMLGVGGALVVGGIVLLFVMGGSEDEEPRDLTVLPSVGPDGAGLHLAGRFGGPR